MIPHETVFELTPEQQVVDEVKLALLGPDARLGSHEACVMVMARLAFRAGKATGHTSGDIPQQIFEHLPKSDTGNDAYRAHDFYSRIFELVMENSVYKQEVCWAFGQGARQNG